jgi:hypothetical protein
LVLGLPRFSVGFAVALLGCSLETEGGLGSDRPDGGIESSTPPAADAGTDSVVAPEAQAPDAGVDVVQPPIDAAQDALQDAPASDVVSEPAGPCSTAPGACVQSVPGWDVVAFATGSPGACPGGYSQLDVQSDPVIGAGACDCSCTITTQPCVHGTIPTYYSNATGCASAGISLTIAGNGCIDFSGGNLGNYYKSPPLPVGGACSGTPITNLGALTTSSSRICLPPAACLEELCSGQAAPGFEACIRQPGDQACPAGPFSKKHLVVEGATFSCSACSNCSVTAECNNPRIEFHSNNSCTNQVKTLASNDTCVGTEGGGYVSSLRYLVDVQNAQCSASGPKQAQLALSNASTVCCR